MKIPYGSPLSRRAALVGGAILRKSPGASTGGRRAYNIHMEIDRNESIGGEPVGHPITPRFEGSEGAGDKASGGRGWARLPPSRVFSRFPVCQGPHPCRTPATATIGIAI